MDSTTSGVTTTLYIGSVEKITQADGSKEIKRYIGGVAIMTLALDTSGATQSRNTHYLYKDHLGSLDIITDAAGQIVQEQSFDAWGQRRDAVNWQDLLAAQLTGFDHSATTRGFTGHEMLDEVGIIHMNGRIYDPKLGRFLQADPFIQEPTNTQSLNRYSYVLNNPLNATDPSGYSFSKLVNAIFDIAKIVVAVVVGVGTGCWECAAYIIGTLSFVQTLGNGGSFGDALLAGVSSAALTYVGGNYFPGGGNFDWTYTLSMGALGGITTTLQGGKFGHGFLSVGVGAASGAIKFVGNATTQLVKRAITSMAIGGTVSKLTGGKFANGAAYAAFAVAVQALASEALPKAAPGASISNSTNNQATTAEGDWRHLTKGEKALAVDNGLSIKNVDKVRVYRKGYLGLDKEIIAPNGNIYIGENNAVGLVWSEDYSLAGLSDQSVFVHEMTHVYQSRTLGCGRLCMGMERLSNSNYDYKYVPGKSFSSYGLEEQAAMMQDRFRLNNGLGHWRKNTSTLDQLNKAIPF